MRVIALILMLVAASWFQFGQTRSARDLWRDAQDLTDPRPARRILIAGNSRTFFNDMPATLRKVADSGGAREKYQIEIDALPGASLESLWNDAPTQRLLAAQWDDAIVQGESRGQSDDQLAQSFMANGARILQAIKLRQGHPRLIVNWNYDPVLFDKDKTERAAHYWRMQAAHLTLAQQTGAVPVNVGKLWEGLRDGLPQLALTTDGNHPTPAASYFVALCLYESLSGGDVRRVTYVPDGVSVADATFIRDLVANRRSEI